MKVLKPLVFKNADLISTTAFETVAEYNVGTDYLKDVFVRYGPVGTRTNLALYSEQFDNAAWTKSAATITANAIAAPDGTTTADKLQEDNTAANHRVEQIPTVTITNPVTLSVFVKAAERTSVGLQILDNGTATSGAAGTFNLSAGTASFSLSGSGASGFVSITPMANGWFRCALTVTTNGTGTAVRARIFPYSGSGSYTGTTGSGVYIWGAQIEAAKYATTYIQTVASAVTPREPGRIYQSLQTPNLNHQPDLVASAAFWQDYGPWNRQAMFDTQASTKTQGSAPLTVVLQPLQFFNSLAFVGLVGTSINVRITDGVGGPEIYNQTKSLDGSVITDWYMYFYEPFDTLDVVTFLDVPVYLNSYITVTVNGTGTVSCGTMLYGTVYELGGTQYGATSGIKDFSVKDTDDFGNTTFVERAYSDRMEANIFMDNSTIRANKKLLASLRATPSLWIGVDDSTYEPLSVFGFYRDFSIDIGYPTFSMCRIEIEGLI